MDVSTETVVDAAVSDSIDDLLSDLSMDDLGHEDPEEVIETLSAGEMEAVEIVSAVSDAYAEAVTSTTSIEAPAREAVTDAPKETKKREKKAKTETAPKAPKDLASIDARVFVLTTDEPADLEANKAAVIALLPKQKKIAEKFENVFSAVSVGKAPSVYVTTCFAVLHAAGSVTSTELVGALKAADYSDGTARSQAGQIMALFDVLGIANREGQKLTYNADAPMSKRLAALPLTK